ncbi:hypothetical protein ACI2KC_14395 [Pseudomonas monteilii]
MTAMLCLIAVWLWGVEALHKSIDDKASGRGGRKLKVTKPQAKKEATEVAPVG